MRETPIFNRHDGRAGGRVLRAPAANHHADDNRGLFAQSVAQPQYAQQTISIRRRRASADWARRKSPCRSRKRRPVAIAACSRRRARRSAHTRSTTYQQPAPQVAPPPAGRGLFNSRSRNAPQIYAQPQPQQPYVVQYSRRHALRGRLRLMAPMPRRSPYEQPYTLDAGDKLRIVVFGQDGISNSLHRRRRRQREPAAGRHGAGARRHHRATVADASPSGSSKATCASRM